MLVRTITKLSLMLSVSLAIAFGYSHAKDQVDSTALNVVLQEEVNSIEKAENIGLNIYIEQAFSGDEFVTIAICLKRKHIPYSISAYFALTVNRPGESRVSDRLLSITQRMLLEDTDSEYDLGRFRIRVDLLPSILLMLGYSDRDTGHVWKDGQWSVNIKFDDVFQELMSDARTFTADFHQISCQQPSGRYIHRR